MGYTAALRGTLLQNYFELLSKENFIGPEVSGD
jgi:hypothetical protein